MSTTVHPNMEKAKWGLLHGLTSHNELGLYHRTRFLRDLTSLTKRMHKHTAEFYESGHTHTWSFVYKVVEKLL